MAGTRPRGSTPEEDKATEAELMADPKERAEHVMLIDLARNDIGRIAKTGSVKVTEAFAVERYSHVMHIVSNVEGILQDGMTSMDVLKATFPAGTLSGAPKVHAMELIDQLEPTKRGIYGGAVGYLSFAGHMDMAIAIRTGVIKDGNSVCAGCGGRGGRLGARAGVERDRAQGPRPAARGGAGGEGLGVSERSTKCSTATACKSACGVNALDDILVPLLVERSGYMTQAREGQKRRSLVRDEARIQTIVHRVRAVAQAQRRRPRPDRAHLPRHDRSATSPTNTDELARLRAEGLHPKTNEGSAMKRLMIDNYDSFTYNIVQYFGELGAEVTVVRNDEITLDEVIELVARKGIERIVISPGPCSPDRGGHFGAQRFSTLPASCPSSACAWATRALARPLVATSSARGPANAWQDQRDHHRPKGRVCRAAQAVHREPLPLAGDRQDHAARLPGDHRRPAEDGEIQGVRHKTLAVEGVQFHPESILTEHGHAMLQNFLEQK